MEKLRMAMKEVQDEARYEHTLGVAYTAACLAVLNGVDSRKAVRAGLLHDCAKCIDDAEQIALCEQYGIAISAFERRNPFLLHAKLGAFVAKKEYGEQDEDILNAIRNHTTGRADMSMLEKIIFVADYIEPGRNKASGLYEIRKLAYENVEHAMVRILQDTLVYLERKGAEIDEATRTTLEFYTRR